MRLILFIRISRNINLRAHSQHGGRNCETPRFSPDDAATNPTKQESKKNQTRTNTNNTRTRESDRSTRSRSIGRDERLVGETTRVRPTRRSHGMACASMKPCRTADCISDGALRPCGTMTDALPLTAKSWIRPDRARERARARRNNQRERRRRACVVTGRMWRRDDDGGAPHRIAPREMPRRSMRRVHHRRFSAALTCI